MHGCGASMPSLLFLVQETIATVRPTNEHQEYERRYSICRDIPWGAPHNAVAAIQIPGNHRNSAPNEPAPGIGATLFHLQRYSMQCPALCRGGNSNARKPSQQCAERTSTRNRSD